MKYLGLSYEESGRYQDAVRVYRALMLNSSDRYASDVRFAHVGIANALIKDKKHSEAADQLEGWLAVHAEDRSSQLLYGDLLVRLKRYSDANMVWQALLRDSAASNEQQAAAHYYLAWIAYLNGNSDMVKQHAKLSLEIEAGGTYSKPARQLMAMKPASRFSGSLSLEEFYTNNVELLPDYVSQSTSGKKNTDFVSQAGLTLSYRFPTVSVSYIFSGNWHTRRPDFDLGFHALSATWTKDNWSITPRYEYVQLARSFLYQGGGMDIAWAKDGWRIAYGGSYKEFSNSFRNDSTAAPSDLRRLGGLSNSLTVSRDGKLDDMVYLISLSVADEATKGDLTHSNKSDSYRQLSGTGSLSRQFEHVGLNLSVNAYVRNYTSADLTILNNPATNLLRRDNHVQLSASSSFKPWKESANTLVLNGSWQKSASNYDSSTVPINLSKAYSEWHAGLAWNYVW